MSHFSVFVIGNDIEQQLAPYHEFECTGEDDQYIQDVDVTDEAKEHGLDRFGLEDRTVTSLDELDLEDAHKYGYALVDADGAVVKAIKRTNPNKQWDWWVVGGRWSKFLKAKAGGQFDSLRKGEIDFAGMRQEAADKAAADWDAAFVARDGKDWITWEHMRDVLHKGSIEAARTAYHEQPALAHMKRTKAYEFSWDPLDKYLMPREEFIRRASEKAVVSFAVVKDGQWYQRGEMGWWGMVSDEKDIDAWGSQVAQLLDGLPDDTLITVVDCHI